MEKNFPHTHKLIYMYIIWKEYPVERVKTIQLRVGALFFITFVNKVW